MDANGLRDTASYTHKDSCRDRDEAEEAGLTIQLRRSLRHRLKALRLRLSITRSVLNAVVGSRHSLSYYGDTDTNGDMNA